MLDALGADRGVFRGAGEQDDQYRIRVRALPDTVSPDAIVRSVRSYFERYVQNADFDFIESWQLGAYSDMDCTDVPAEASKIWLDDVEYRAMFVIRTVPYGGFSETGIAYDDPGSAAVDFVTPPPIISGHRATPAYDIPGLAAGVALSGCLDGYDVGASALYGKLFDMLQSIKAGGVVALVVFEPVAGPPPV
jgi:hypothetical protein